MTDSDGRPAVSTWTPQPGERVEVFARRWLDDLRTGKYKDLGLTQEQCPPVNSIGFFIGRVARGADKGMYRVNFGSAGEYLYHPDEVHETISNRMIRERWLGEDPERLGS